MQFNHDFDQDTSLAVAWGVRTLVLARSSDDPLLTRVASIGGPVEAETELYAGLSTLLDDPMGHGLFIMDCDAHGGAEAGQRALRTIAAANLRVPVILISKDHVRQVFPQSRTEAVELRAPVSRISLRVAFEHALRDRLVWAAA